MHGPGSGPQPAADPAAAAEASSWYSLYGVVTHKGDISGGHYIAFVR